MRVLHSQWRFITAVAWVFCAVLTLAACFTVETSEDAIGALLAIGPVAGAVSLADQVGSLRREIGAKLEARGKLYDEAGKLEAEEATLRAKADRTEADHSRLAELREQIGAKYKAARGLTQEIDTLNLQEREIQSRIDERNAHNTEVVTRQQSAGRTVQPGYGQVNLGSDVRVLDRPLSAAEQDADIAAFVRCQGMAKLSGIHPIAYARDSLRNDRLAQAMTAANNAGMIPDTYVPRIIELLRPRSVVRQMGPRLLPMSNGNLRMPAMTTGASASYTGENANITASTPDTTPVTLTAKKLTVLVPCANELIRRGTAGADQMIRDDMIAAVAMKEDSTFLRSDGTSNTPKGLRYWANSSTHRPAANATVNAANTIADLSTLLLKVVNSDTPMLMPGWIMHPRTKEYLSTLAVSGIKVFRKCQKPTPSRAIRSTRLPKSQSTWVRERMNRRSSSVMRPSSCSQKSRPSSWRLRPKRLTTMARLCNRRLART